MHGLPCAANYTLKECEAGRDLRSKHMYNFIDKATNLSLNVIADLGEVKVYQEECASARVRHIIPTPSQILCAVHHLPSSAVPRVDVQ